MAEECVATHCHLPSGIFTQVSEYSDLHILVVGERIFRRFLIGLSLAHSVAISTTGFQVPQWLLRRRHAGS
jgi:hypothetical protein